MSAESSENEEYIFKSDEPQTSKPENQVPPASNESKGVADAPESNASKPSKDNIEITEVQQLEKGSIEQFRKSPLMTDSMWNTLKAKQLYPIQVCFKHISFSVTVKVGKSKIPCNKLDEQKYLLKNISGSIEPGEIIAIMGASGAGKTTLLNVLAGRAQGKIEGDVLFNGNNRNVSASFLRKYSAYIMQDDLLMRTQTPEEILLFAANLRISEATAEQRRQRVDAVIEELNLENCRKTIVGAPGIRRGISGGERKRVSIGTELLNNPSLLFVDEPTTGLDSFTAESVMHTLRNLAKSGRTIITTIHQPNSQIFQLFDKLLLLAKGEPIFFGPANEAVSYFKSIGYKCPSYSNPADYFIEICHIDQTKPEEGEKKIQYLIDSYRASKMCQKHENAVVTHVDPPEGQTYSGYARNAFVQFLLLLQRGFRDYVREPLKIRASIGQTIFISIILGLIYLHISTNQHSAQDREGALFFLMVNNSMTAIALIVNLFPAEKPLIMRELSNNMYRASSFYISKVFTDLPFQLLYPTIFTVIFYWMIGFKDDAATFFITLGAVLLVSNVAASIGLSIGIGAKDANTAFAMIPLVLMPFMIFSGYFVNVASCPDYFIWIQDLSFIRWGFSILINEQLSGLTFTCSESEEITFCFPIPGRNGTESCESRCPLQDGQQVIDSLDFNNDPVWRNFVILASMWVFFRLLGYVLLRLQTRKPSA